MFYDFLHLKKYIYRVIHRGWIDFMITFSNAVRALTPIAISLIRSQDPAVKDLCPCLRRNKREKQYISAQVLLSSVILKYLPGDSNSQQPSKDIN